MNRARFIVALFLLATIGALVESCGGGGAVGPGNGPFRVPIAVPPFTSYSTDLALNQNEGTAADPLRIAWSPNCVFRGIFPDCNTPWPEAAPRVWPQSNAAATTLDWFRWRVVINNEDTWGSGCNTGPPNQSLALAQYPLTWEPSVRSVRFGFELANEAANCSKNPYISVSYVRGVQGDPQRNLLSWSRHPQLVIFTHTDHSSDLPTHHRTVYFWIHLRDPATGKRWMAQRVLDGWPGCDVNPRGCYTADFAWPWNWPLTSSFQFAGEGLGPYLHGGRVGCEDFVHAGPAPGEWKIDVEEFSTCRFPELAQVKPDFLGFEIAVEGGYTDYKHPTGQPNRLVLQLSDVALTADP